MKKKNYREEYRLIGGIDQYLLHYSIAQTSAVMIFLNGGPGSAESNFGYFFEKYWSQLNVVYWDQRGAGKTLSKNPQYTDYPITFEQLMCDLAEVVNYVKTEYAQERVILLGHSWGTILGSCYCLQKPEDVSLYIGVGQVVDVQENERVGFAKVMEEAQLAGNHKDVAKLKAVTNFPLTHFDKEGLKTMMTVRKLQMKYHLAAKLTWPLIKCFVKSPVFKWSDIGAMMKANQVNRELIDYLMKFDINKLGHKYQVPMCLIQGERDFQVQTSLAVAYFEQIEAPQKQVHVIPKAGHNTMFDQPKLFGDALSRGLKMIEPKSD